jgi:hypothetical protein
MKSLPSSTRLEYDNYYCCSSGSWYFCCCCYDNFVAIDVLIVFVDAFGMSVVEIAFVITLVVTKSTFAYQLQLTKE